MATRSEVERIAALEVEVRKDRESILDGIAKLEASQKVHFKAQEKRIDAIEKRLDGAENKGKGILIGLSMAAALTGASVLAFLERILGVFK